MEGMRKTIFLIALCFFAVLGLILTIVSCVLNKNAYPLLLVIMYVVVFIPDWICRRAHFDERECCVEHCSDRYETYISTGHFFTAFLGVSGISLPIVLFRAGLLLESAFILSLVGIVLFVASVVAFIHGFYIKEDGF